jgi:hypothetical protein
MQAYNLRENSKRQVSTLTRFSTNSVLAGTSQVEAYQVGQRTFNVLHPWRFVVDTDLVNVVNNRLPARPTHVVPSWIRHLVYQLTGYPPQN